MKQIIAVLLLTLPSLSFADKVDVPKAVKKACEAKYPDIKVYKWEKDAHDNYEAHFKIDGEKYRADFDKDGNWIETENDIKTKNLPEPIKKIIGEKYDDEKITEVEHVRHHSKGEFYDVEFKRKGKNKDVMFRADGSIL